MVKALPVKVARPKPQRWLSKEHPRILPDPLVKLYANRSPDSRAAFEMLDAADILVDVIRSPRRIEPEARWGPLQFRGIKAIKELVEASLDIREINVTGFRTSHPEWFQGPVPPDEQADAREAQWRAYARSVIDDLVPTNGSNGALDQPEIVDQVHLTNGDLHMGATKQRGARVYRRTLLKR